MSLIKVTEALIAERGFNDELLVNLTLEIDRDLAANHAYTETLKGELQALSIQRSALEKRKQELATEFEARHARLSALIGEEGAGNG